MSIPSRTQPADLIEYRLAFRCVNGHIQGVQTSDTSKGEVAGTIRICKTCSKNSLPCLVKYTQVYQNILPALFGGGSWEAYPTTTEFVHYLYEETE